MAELSPSSTAAEVIAHLRSLGSEENRQGMKCYGIRIDRVLGISHGVQREIARKIKRTTSAPSNCGNQASPRPSSSLR